MELVYRSCGFVAFSRSALCILVFLTCRVNGQSSAFNVTFLERSPVKVERGSSVTLTCRIDRAVPDSGSRPLPLLLTHIVEFWKESREPGLTSPSEGQLLTQQANVVGESSDPDHYGVSQVSGTGDPNTTTFALTIRNVVDADGGRYVCRIKTREGPIVVGQNSIDVMVPEDIEVVLIIGNTSASSSATSVQVVKIMAGFHRVSCLARGTNPATAVDIALGQEALPAISEIPVVAKSPASTALYTVLKEATFHVTTANKEIKLSCKSKNGITEAIVTLFVVVSDEDTESGDEEVSGDEKTDEPDDKDDVTSRDPRTVNKAAAVTAKLPVTLTTLVVLALVAKTGS